MELRNIKTFIRVAELNSFSRAASQLSYAQSTVTSQIESLEKELGVDLFIRNGKRISLSSAGRDFLTYAYYMRSIDDEIHSHFCEESAPIGTIHIGILESLCASPYMDCIARFLQDYPSVRLKITIDTTIHLRQMLQKGEVDLIVLLDFLSYNPLIRLLYSKSIPIQFFAAPNHAVFSRQEIKLEDLIGENWLLTEKGCNYRKLLEDDLAVRKLHISDRLEIGSTKTIIDFVAQGLGISLLPSYDLTEAVKEKSIRIVQFVDYQMSMNIQVIVSNERWLSPSVNLLSEFLISRFND